MRNPSERLRDILDAISAIERYMDRGKAEFERDERSKGGLFAIFKSSEKPPGRCRRTFELRHRKLNGPRLWECGTFWCMAISRLIRTSSGMPLPVMFRC